MPQIILFCNIFVVLLLISARPVHAYLDPGSGSYLIQILVATLAGAGLLARSQWDRIKNIFSGKKDQSPKDKNGK